jgi:hypothetical protein
LLPLLNQVPAEAWTKIKDEIHAAVRQYERNGAIEFGAAIVLASARK